MHFHISAFNVTYMRYECGVSDGGNKTKPVSFAVVAAACVLANTVINIDYE